MPQASFPYLSFYIICNLTIRILTVRIQFVLGKGEIYVS